MTRTALVLLALCGACYSSSDADPCTVRCSSTGECPTDMTCGTDQFCHAPGDTTDCGAEPPDPGPGPAPADPCTNGALDGAETAADCGGPDCAACLTGSSCLEARDCLSGICTLGACEANPRSCAGALAADPGDPSGMRVIDPDGAGDVEPFSVYCEQDLMDGGWQLVSVVPQGGIRPPGSATTVPILGDGMCLDPLAPCAGHIDPSQASREIELAILDVPSGEYIIVTGWSNTDNSALKFFTRDRNLTNSDGCGVPHVCNGVLDPELALTTSGFPLAYAPPLKHWWRLGGWWVGASPNASDPEGNLFRSSYNRVNLLNTRFTPTGHSTVRVNGDQRIFARIPAP